MYLNINKIINKLNRIIFSIVLQAIWQILRLENNGNDLSTGFLAGTQNFGSNLCYSELIYIINRNILTLAGFWGFGGHGIPQLDWEQDDTISTEDNY